MKFYSIWPFFVALGLVLAFAASPIMKMADSTPPPPSHTNGSKHINTLDGLRGFLAIGVYFCHSSIYHNYLTDGTWNSPSQFYMLLGQGAVAMFFMITGFLFWTHLIDSDGKPVWLKLYVGRFFRIAPLYLFAVTTMAFVDFSRADFHLQVPLSRLATETLRWLALGYYLNPSFNGDSNAWRILAGVTWTLRYEWQFYFSLLFTALVARYRQAQLPFTLIVLAGSSFFSASKPHSKRVYVVLFLCGMVTASLKKEGLVLRASNALTSTAVLALLLFAFCAYPTAYDVLPALTFGVVFYLIATGSTVFGILTTRAARRLGNISYGIYLLQGLILTMVFIPARSLALASPWQYWGLVYLCALLLVLAAMLTHAYIELPGIVFGRRALGRNTKIVKV